jgi:hypothetical protein
MRGAEMRTGGEEAVTLATAPETSRIQSTAHYIQNTIKLLQKNNIPDIW